MSVDLQNCNEAKGASGTPQILKTFLLAGSPLSKKALIFEF